MAWAMLKTEVILDMFIPCINLQTLFLRCKIKLSRLMRISTSIVSTLCLNGSDLLRRFVLLNWNGSILLYTDWLLEQKARVLFTALASHWIVWSCLQRYTKRKRVTESRIIATVCVIVSDSHSKLCYVNVVVSYITATDVDV